MEPPKRLRPISLPEGASFGLAEACSAAGTAPAAGLAMRALGIWLIFGFGLAANLCGQTFQERLDAAVAAFGEGDYAATYWHFEALEIDFGAEPEYTEAAFERATLPVRAYAALMSDRPTDASIYFAKLLRDYELGRGLRAFALYHLALAQSQTGAKTAAARTYAGFAERFRTSREAYLADLQRADLLIEIGENAEAVHLLEAVYQSPAEDTLRMQARLRHLQLARDQDEPATAQKLLFETDWAVDAMPEIAVLSFAALATGDLLLQDARQAEAIRAYRLAIPRALLIDLQSSRLSEAERRMGRERVYASPIWQGHMASQIARLRGQLETLESMADYTPGLYLRSGQAYLLSERYREAILLFKTIAGNADYSESIRAQAHYRQIVALLEFERWEAARAEAEAFTARYPEHELVNPALFLIARAYQGAGDFLSAIAVLDRLIRDYPNDSSAARWYFTRGYNLSVLERQTAARASFREGVERFPGSPLATRLKLWEALTYFFERDYAAAITALDALAASSMRDPLYPEIRYRTANAHYGAKDFTATLRVLDDLIEAYADHHRIPAALALRGDVLMALGELDEAVSAFAQVQPEASSLYDYAVFQIAKIHRALGEQSALRAHLGAYIESEGAAGRPRLSEAVYWVARSLQEDGLTEAAFALYEDALQRFGDLPEALSVGSILGAYARLYDGEGTDRPAFEVWLRSEREQGLEGGALTWFARLTKFESDRKRAAGESARADAALLSIHRLAPLEALDAGTLAAVGLVLADRGYASADAYFEYLLDHYGTHPERAAAYFGKAILARAAREPERALPWLERFLVETPTHRLAGEARLLAAEVLAETGRVEAARQALDEILSIKELRGRTHARALASLARLESAADRPERAIPYWQRIYTLYRAYPELLAEAYWESAALFESIGDAEANLQTLREMLEDPRLNAFPQYQQAATKLEILEAERAKTHEAPSS